MTDLNDMTKKELLELAKEHEVTGRHDMTKDELVAALEEILDEDDNEDDNEDLGNEPKETFITKEQLVALKRNRREKSALPRGENGKIIRQGLNLSGNVPYTRKFYALGDDFMDLDTAGQDYREAVEAAPMQVQLLLKAMRSLGIDEENPMTGPEIAGLAINQGFLQTRIAPANLFAYYRRVLEALGVRQVGDVE